MKPVVFVFALVALLVSAASEATAQSAQQRAIDLFDRAQTRSDKGDFDGAIALLTEAIKLDPTFSSYFSERARLRGEKKGDFSGAISDYDNAFRLSPSSLVVGNRARMKRDKGDLSGAFADFQTSLRYKDADPALYAGRGITFLLADNRERAFADFREFIKLEKLDLTNESASLPCTAAFSDEQAIAICTMLIEEKKLPDRWLSIVHFHRGGSWHRLGHYLRAVADYDAALRLDTENKYALFSRGIALRAAGKNDGPDLNTLIKMLPDSHDFDEVLEKLARKDVWGSNLAIATAVANASLKMEALLIDAKK